MIKNLLIFLANLALPFILFAIRNWVWRLWLARQKHKRPEQVTPPTLDFSRALRLVFYGLLMFFLFMVALRMSDNTASPRTPRSSDTVIDY
ncbi:MAG: hypothetical protein GC134_09205 [Proteobacteria bacterium]|nr:hypothetical protein [Pseudomonadota bacterium]